ncbi:hypothetical protein X975_13724, partial [Stegodyphus mimosarum]
MPAIMQAVAEWMNLNVTYAREPGDDYGTLVNNTYTGMCGRLFRNEADIILNPLLPRDDFHEFAYFTHPIIFEAFTILSGKKKQEGGLFLYFSVLEP